MIECQALRTLKAGRLGKSFVAGPTPCSGTPTNALGIHVLYWKCLGPSSQHVGKRALPWGGEKLLEVPASLSLHQGQTKGEGFVLSLVVVEGESAHTAL